MKDWCWRWRSNILATWYEELTHWKRLWCWERLKVEGEEGEEDKMVGWNHQFNGHELGKLREMMRERMAWRPAVHRVAKSQKRLINWTITTTLNNLISNFSFVVYRNKNYWAYWSLPETILNSHFNSMLFSIVYMSTWTTSSCSNKNSLNSFFPILNFFFSLPYWFNTTSIKMSVSRERREKNKIK